MSRLRSSCSSWRIDLHMADWPRIVPTMKCSVVVSSPVESGVCVGKFVGQTEKTCTGFLRIRAIEEVVEFASKQRPVPIRIPHRLCARLACKPGHADIHKWLKQGNEPNGPQNALYVADKEGCKVTQRRHERQAPANFQTLCPPFAQACLESATYTPAIASVCIGQMDSELVQQLGQSASRGSCPVPPR